MLHKNHSSDLAKLVRSFHVPSSKTDDAIQLFFESLNCPRSLTCLILYRNMEHQQLVELDVNENDYKDHFSFRDAYAASMFLAKSNFLKLNVSRKEKAYQKFFEFENLCKQTNDRFKNLSLDPLFKGPNVWLLNATIQKIDKILGSFDPEEFVDSANWGPGVSTLLKGEEVSAVNKFHSENGITRGLYSLVSSWFHVAYPRWFEHRTSSDEMAFAIEAGNTIVTVPKNSKTDRVIAVEPGLNLWFQKGLGAMIRRRLRRWGVDLNSQTRNQELARRGSIRNDLATVDFSSASDSVAREVVRELIPRPWLSLLEATRSTVGIHNSQPIQWQKFSSMGNGYTFELESLIFFAAAHAVCEYQGVSCSDVSVYGDDVILPTECYELFASFSMFLGFKVNTDKSFSSGPFRESCGSHYYEGVDVKPIFLKERIRNVQAIYKLANSVRNLAHRRNSNYGCDARFHRCWRHLYSWVPKPLRFRSSVELGDCGFAGNFDEATPVTARDGIEGFFTRVVLEDGVTRQSDSPAVLLARLKVPSTELSYKNDYTLRGRTRTRVAKVFVPRWYNFGPWF